MHHLGDAASSLDRDAATPVEGGCNVRASQLITDHAGRYGIFATCRCRTSMWPSQAIAFVPLKAERHLPDDALRR